jgi:flagellar assembly protein FliH
LALIKHSDSDVLAREAVVLDLGDLTRQAQQIIADAQDRAAHIIANAKQDRKRMINGAHEKGFAAGHEEGVEAGHQEGLEKGCAQALAEHGDRLELLEKSWKEALDRFDARRDKMLNDARIDVLRLAMAIARRVTRRIIENDETTIQDQLEQALMHTLEPTRLFICVHAEDEALITASAPSLLSRFARSASAEIVTDESLSRGDCVVQTDAGEIDARIDAQLDRIAEALGLSVESVTGGEPSDDSSDDAEDQA